MLQDKELGVVLTPLKTADYIVSRLGSISEEHRICDPCVGPGVFIESLLRAGVNKNQIIAFDVNPSYKSRIEQYNVSFKTQDTLLT